MTADDFAAFYRRSYRLVLSVAQQRLGDFAAAEDAAAEVFRIAWAQVRAGNEPNLPWLYVTLRNVVGNEYRRAGRAEALAAKVATRSVDAAQPGFIGDDAPEDAIVVRDALAKLPSADRGLLIMTYWEDLTTAECAQILGSSPTAVRIRLMRARRRLAAFLGDEGRFPTTAEVNDD
jgi:RNA polymerase sigma-70 factor (ECF subfamily)